MQLGIELGELIGRSFKALWEMKPKPRHSKWGRNSKTSARMASALGLPSSRTTSGVLIFYLAAALPDLSQEHGNCLQDVEGLEAGGHERLAVLRADKSVGPLAYDSGHVPGAEEAVEA